MYEKRDRGESLFCSHFFGGSSGGNTVQTPRKATLRHFMPLFGQTNRAPMRIYSVKG